MQVCNAVTFPEALLWQLPLHCIECKVGAILLLHAGMLPLFKTPYPSFGPTG